MKDIRHDNLNPFLGVSIEAPLICIITEYCSRGSLQVRSKVNYNLLFFSHTHFHISSLSLSLSLALLFKVVLQNENFHLDNIFAASMIGDIIRVSLYFSRVSTSLHGLD